MYLFEDIILESVDTGSGNRYDEVGFLLLIQLIKGLTTIELEDLLLGSEEFGRGSIIPPEQAEELRAYRRGRIHIILEDYFESSEYAPKPWFFTQIDTPRKSLVWEALEAEYKTHSARASIPFGTRVVFPSKPLPYMELFDRNPIEAIVLPYMCKKTAVYFIFALFIWAAIYPCLIYVKDLHGRISREFFSKREHPRRPYFVFCKKDVIALFVFIVKDMIRGVIRVADELYYSDPWHKPDMKLKSSIRDDEYARLTNPVHKQRFIERRKMFEALEKRHERKQFVAVRRRKKKRITGVPGYFLEGWFFYLWSSTALWNLFVFFADR